MNCDKLTEDDSKIIEAMLVHVRNQRQFTLIDVVLNNDGFIKNVAEKLSQEDADRITQGVLEEYIKYTNILLRLYDYKIEREEATLNKAIMEYFKLRMVKKQLQFKKNENYMSKMLEKYGRS